MNKHHRLLTRLINTPLAISQDKLEVISSNVSLKLLAGQALDTGVATPTEKTTVTSKTTAVINVFDSLVSKGGAGESGFTSYAGIKSSVQQAIAKGANTLLFYIDSPGGEVSGLFGLSSYIASLPDTYGVETIAFTDGSMTSAAYAIGSAAQQVYATESSTVGSIGVIMSLVDVTEADTKAGYSYTILRSKEDKALYNPHEQISSAVIDKYSAMLAELDSLFNAEVAKNRPQLTLEAIVNMKADAFLGNKALELGLIDGIVSSMDEVINLNVNSTKRGDVMTLEELKAQLSAKDTELATLQASVTNTVAKAIADERARCLDILAAGQTLKITAEQVNKRISAGTAKEDAVDIFTAIADAIGTSTAIDTATPVEATVSKTLTTEATDTKVEIEGTSYSISDIVAAAHAISKGAK